MSAFSWKRVRDPVCQREVDVGKFADIHPYKRRVYYFCSVECKEAFIREPRKYVGAPKGLEHEHALESRMGASQAVERG